MAMPTAARSGRLLGLHYRPVHHRHADDWNTPSAAAIAMKTEESRMRRTPVMTALAIGGLAALAATGCTSEPPSRVVSAPPPDAAPAVAHQQTVVVPQGTATSPAVATSPATVIVQQAPPAVQQESMPRRPSDSHVWVAGYWAWQSNQYVWVPGRWVIPPRMGATWVPPRWEREGTNYRFYDGYWAD